MLNHKHYCKAHLLLFEKAVGEDWERFLSRPDRLAAIMAIAQPLTLNEIEFLSGGPITWDCLPMLVSDNWYGIWPDTTGEEEWVARQIGLISLDWLDQSCYSDDSSKVAKKLGARYIRLLKSL